MIKFTLEITLSGTNADRPEVVHCLQQAIEQLNHGCAAIDSRVLFDRNCHHCGKWEIVE